MQISKQALAIVGVTIDDYLEWCLNNNKASYKNETKKEFFTKIKEGRIVRDNATKKLITKKVG